MGVIAILESLVRDGDDWVITGPESDRARLAYAALDGGGRAPAILNAANEFAVARFLAGEIGFTEIPDPPAICDKARTARTDADGRYAFVVETEEVSELVDQRRHLIRPVAVLGQRRADGADLGVNLLELRGSLQRRVMVDALGSALASFFLETIPGWVHRGLAAIGDFFVSMGQRILGFTSS